MNQFISILKMKLSMNVTESKTLREKFVIRIEAKFYKWNENNHKKIVVAASGHPRGPQLP